MKPVGSLLYDALFSLALAAGALAIGFVAHAILTAFLKRRQDRHVGGRRRSLSLQHLKSPLRSLIPAICVSSVLPLLRLPKDIRGALAHLVGLWVIGSIAWLLSGSVLAARDTVLSGYDFAARDDLHARRVATQVRVIERILITIIVFVTAAVMLMTFSKVRQIGVSLLASAGIISIIVGLAAQKTLGNIIAGIQIAFAQPIRLGDVVVVENESGHVEEITLTYVVVRLWDLRRLVLPISYFVDHPFQNWTRRSSAVLGTVFLYTDYKVSVEEVRSELRRILENSRSWDKKVNGLQVTNATERTIELRALMSAEDSATLWDLRCEVREKLLDFLQKRFPESLPRVRLRIERDQTPAGEPGPVR